MWNLWWILIASTIITIVAIILVCKVDGFFHFGLYITSILCACGFGMISFVTVFVGVSLSIRVKNEYLEFIETKAMVTEVYGREYNQLENAGLNNKIIEVNQWLVSAKASKKQWGNWSKYCTVDIDGLEYITLGGQDNG